MNEQNQPQNDWTKEEPLGPVKCTSTDCENDRHCFRKKRFGDGSCRSERCVRCGVEKVDWKRIEKKDLTDTPYTIKSLNYEYVRYYFWHTPIDEYAVNHARRKGLEGLKPWTTKRLADSIGDSAEGSPWDGRQTPTSGRVVYYAQHATACCCRKCADEWHGIARDRPLRNAEIDYLTALIMLYIRTRLPQLTQYGEKVPAMSRSRSM